VGGTFDDDADPATECIACTPCGDTEYNTELCSPTTDQICASCTEPQDGEFVVSPCIPGNEGEIGSDTDLTTCSEPGDGEYVTALCQRGSPAEHGSDTEIATCSQAELGELVTDVCVPGSSSQLGSDTSVTTCSEPAPGDFVTTTCEAGDDSTPGTDTQVTACTEPGPEEYIATACVAGSSDSVGIDTSIAACTAIANCASGLSCTSAIDSTCGVCDSGYTLSASAGSCQSVAPSAGPLNWGIEPEYQNVYVFALDMGNSILGSTAAHSSFCASELLSVPNDSWPSNSGCTGGGGVFNSNGQACALHTTAQDFFYNQVVPAFPGATYDDILILQGNSPNCWAHNAEPGSMYAFGGPSGTGYSFCRSGDTAAKRYHIYVCS
jgi:hypothetical protein